LRTRVNRKAGESLLQKGGKLHIFFLENLFAKKIAEDGNMQLHLFMNFYPISRV
jgi:hypothetical protein